MKSSKYSCRTQVNKGSINKGRFEAKLHEYGAQGWRLVHLIEQKGNTIMVWEQAT